MMFELFGADGLPNGAAEAGMVTDSKDPTAKAAVKAIEARCFKSVTPS